MRPRRQAPSSLNECKLQLLDLCFENQKTHIGSSFSVLPTLHKIYSSLGDSDRVVLSNGHAAAGLYVILANFYKVEIKEFLDLMGDHPKRSEDLRVHCSTGSLGMGLPVAVGMALSNPKIAVHCLISDGECAEGAIWEALAFAQIHKLNNLHVYAILNGWSAYDTIDRTYLRVRLQSFLPNIHIVDFDGSFLQMPGLSAHYSKLSTESYSVLRGVLEN